MTTKTKKRSRLRGWVRLWIVATGLSWLAGGADLAMSPEPLPLFGAGPPTSVRRLLWFLGPLVVAALWIAVRWVWHGFRPPPDEASASHMGTMEAVQHARRVLVKIGLSLFMLTAAAAFVAFGVMVGTNKGASKSFWDELFILFQFVIAAWFAWLAWEQLTESADDEGKTGSE